MQSLFSWKSVWQSESNFRKSCNLQNWKKEVITGVTRTFQWILQKVFNTIPYWLSVRWSQLVRGFRKCGWNIFFINSAPRVFFSKCRYIDIRLQMAHTYFLTAFFLDLDKNAVFASDHLLSLGLSSKFWRPRKKVVQINLYKWAVFIFSKRTPRKGKII